MKGALVILAVLIAVGIVLYILECRTRRRMAAKRESGDLSTEEPSADAPEGEAVGTEVVENRQSECCGLHLVCEKESLSPMSEEVIYYDDEELDRFVGRSGEDYTPEETEEFRDVLMTLMPSDVAGWARSITQRRIELPGDVRDELLMLVREARDAAKLR